MIIDMMGRVIATLIDQDYPVGGQYTVRFNGEHLADGVYCVRLQNGAVQQLRAMLKVRAKFTFNMVSCKLNNNLITHFSPFVYPWAVV